MAEERRVSPAVVIGIGAVIGIATAVGIYAIARAAPPPKPYSCPLCGATFTSLSELEDHFESAHPWTPIDIIWV